MTKTIKEYDSWGDPVIYVLKCAKYEWENPETPPIKLSKYNLCKPVLHKKKKRDKIVIR